MASDRQGDTAHAPRRGGQSGKTAHAVACGWGVLSGQPSNQVAAGVTVLSRQGCDWPETFRSPVSESLDVIRH